MLSRFLTYCKMKFLRWRHPEWFSGLPQPGEDTSLRDGLGIIDARRNGLIHLGKLSIARDGDRILLQGDHGSLWIDKEGGHIIGEIANVIDADGDNDLMDRSIRGLI